ncbi:MAG TPA: hypothetical protein VGO47_05250 [Chlamydiales bacterium]|nr:hypothetical protein [Chlamydiales bacterium]
MHINDLAGIKMRTHIAKALKTRSKTIRSAVEHYNQVAKHVDPPRASLDVAQVLDHVFLAEFDLLRHSRYNVQELPWTRSAEREAQMVFLKIQRAKEEVIHLNIEVRRLQTYMRDEERFLAAQLEELRTEDQGLGLQLQRKLTHLRALNQIHYNRISQIHRLSSFSGIRICGIRDGLTDNRLATGEGKLVLEEEADDSSEADSEHEEMHELLDAVSTGLDNMTLD